MVCVSNDSAVQYSSAQNTSRSSGRQLAGGCIAQLAVALGAAAMELQAGPV
jgi:hypothetical protein